jgi:hypothetical protein
MSELRVKLGHATAQLISHQLPTVMAWVWVWVKSCVICGGQSGTGPGFLQVFQFLLPLIHSANCSTIIQFNSLLFMCRVNSHKANYRHSTVQIYITT